MYRAVLSGRLHVRLFRVYRRIRLGDYLRKRDWEIHGQSAPHRIFILRNSSLRIWGTSNPFFFFGCLNQNDLLFGRSMSSSHFKLSSCASSLDGRTIEIRTWDLNNSIVSVQARVDGKASIHTRPETNPEMAVKRCFPSTHSRTLA